MVKKTRIYVDTAAFIAFLDRSDTYHSLFGRLFSDPLPLLTSPLVIAEGQAWFLKRYDVTRSLQFLDFIRVLKPLHILSIGSSDLDKASSYVRKFLDQELTMADAMGLHLMTHHKIKTCWSTDRHLSLTGVPLVIHQVE